MKIKTKSGTEVELTTQLLNGKIQARIEAEHPQAGKIVATGLWGTLEGHEGVVDLHASVGKNCAKLCFEVPKADYDAVVTVAIKKQEAEENAEWQKLIDRLPEIELPVGEKNETEYNRLMNESNQVKFFNGPEMDGVNMAANRRKNELRKAAQLHCEHSWKEEIEKSLTHDSRRKVTRIFTCEICKIKISQSVEEELSDENYWR